MTPVERVVLPVAIASAAVGLATVTGGDVGSMARLDDMASDPREVMSLVSAGGWVLLGVMRTGVGNTVVLGDEYRWLVWREEDDAGVPVGLAAVPRSTMLFAMLAVFDVRRPGAVSKVGGTELGLEARDGLCAAVMVATVVELTVTEAGAGDSATARVTLWPPPSTSPEDVPSPAGPVDMGSDGWPGAGVRTTLSLEPGPTCTPSEGKGGLAGARGDAVASLPSPRSETRTVSKWEGNPPRGLGEH